MTTTTQTDRVDSWSALRAWRLAIQPSTLKPRTILLCLLIADHVHRKDGADQWQAWPSHSTLAKVNRDSLRDVPRRVREAADAGWLRIVAQGRPGRNARYELTFPTGATPGDSPVTIPGDSPVTIPGESPVTIPGDSPGRSSEDFRSESGGKVRRTSKAVGADPARPGGRPVTPTEPATFRPKPGTAAARKLELVERMMGRA